MEETKKQTILDKVWDFFTSVTLAVVLFALIAGTSMVGTILEQNAEPEKNINILVKIFRIGHETAHSVYSILEKLGFMDMYSSWWFTTLLFLFAANLIICSIDRLPRILKLIKEPVKPLTDEQFNNIGKKGLLLKGKPEKVKDSVGAVVKRSGFNFSETKEARGYQLHSEKGNYTRLGIFVAHFSILLILIGAIIGIFFGFKGYVEVPEGESRTFAFKRTAPLTSTEETDMQPILKTLQKTEGNASETAKHMGIDEKILRKKMNRYGILPLGFSIRCDDFSVEFYGRSNMPKDYKSWLTVIKGGKSVPGFERQKIEVNDPLIYDGITFYQSNYGLVPGAQGLFLLKLTSKTGVSETKQLHLGDRFVIPETGMEATLADFSPALSFKPGGTPFTSDKQMTNPAVLIEFSGIGQTKYSGWIMKRYPETWTLPDGSTIEPMDIWGVELTGLQVRKDPGVWLVYFGCISMSIGLFIAFFMSHKKLWVKLVEEKNNTRVIFALTANKNRPGFERKIDKMIALLGRPDTKPVVTGKSGGGKR
ncbi:MAG: cytochrome c biogenesis protein ResB [Nitrospirae bacterium]|nr:cytochrome c biogenesis protein ResB [Nitrospirota bacterium]